VIDTLDQGTSGVTFISHVDETLRLDRADPVRFVAA